MGGRLNPKEIITLAEEIKERYDENDCEPGLLLPIDKTLDELTIANTPWPAKTYQIATKANDQRFEIDLIKSLVDSGRLSPKKVEYFTKLAAELPNRPDYSPSPTPQPTTFPPPGPPPKPSHRRYQVATGLLLIYATAVQIGSRPLPVQVMREMPSEQVRRSITEGRNLPDVTGRRKYEPVSTGYSISHNDFDYAVNERGSARIAFNMIDYVFAFTSGTVDLQLKSQGRSSVGIQKYPLPFGLSSKLEIILEPDNDAPGPVMGGLPVTMGGEIISPVEGRMAALQDEWTLVSQAQAQPAKGGRLYIQSASLAATVEGNTAEASLSLGRVTKPLVALAPGLASVAKTSLPIRGDATVVQDYQLFFEVPAPSLADFSITLKASQGLFASDYTNTFTFPGALRIGEPVRLGGKDSASLVVQLTKNIDVVFFERANTSETTKALIPLVAKAGYVPRVNANAATSAQSYNVVYSGQDVPIADLQNVLKVLFDKGVEIRSIQPNLRLRNGLQNQIQIGGNARLSCLDRLSTEQQARLTASESAFNDVVASLPKEGCP